jgi:hypothetical protein
MRGIVPSWTASPLTLRALIFSILPLVKLRARAQGLRIAGTSWASSARPTGSIQMPSTGRKLKTPPPVSAMPAGTRTHAAPG